MCTKCGDRFPIIDGIPRMLLAPMREQLLDNRSLTDSQFAAEVATARSFGFEWTRFSEMYSEWERNFDEYMSPLDPTQLKGKRVLDAGCGSGRHAYYASRFGAQVWAVDLGPAVEIARRNTSQCANVQVVQADLNRLPFERESFDLVYSIGVLHHLPEPEAAFRNILDFVKPGGAIQVYLYWKPEGQPFKAFMLGLVSLTRSVTTRLPHRALYALSYPAAWLAFASFVWPYKAMRRIPGLRSAAERLPMKQYADYPFRVCVNDQFDRFSAPIENRYTRREVEAWLKRAGLEEVVVHSNFGWVGSGRKKSQMSTQEARLACVE
jgi:SAM-dependent methyltransferase